MSTPHTPGNPPGSRSISKSKSKHGRGRAINVYDAVAGHITTSHTPFAGGAHTSRDSRLAPEDVLFRRKHAPTRYAEDDFYWAHESLPPGVVLPASDLLVSIHGYASRYYDALARRVRGRVVDERSMDETALLAFGILLEEAGREVVSREKGERVFVEGRGNDGRGRVGGGGGRGMKDGEKGQGVVKGFGEKSERVVKRRRIEEPVGDFWSGTVYGNRW